MLSVDMMKFVLHTFTAGRWFDAVCIAQISASVDMMQIVLHTIYAVCWYDAVCIAQI